MTDQISARDAAGRIRELEQEVARLRAVDSDARQFETILDNSPQAILIHRGSAPLYVNMAFVRLIGLGSREAALALSSAVDVAHPEDRAFVVSQVQARIAGIGYVPHFEARVLTSSGAVVWVDCYAARILWRGAPAGLVTMTDITLHKKTEASQRHSEKLLSTVFRVSPDPISLTTMKDGRYIDVNDSFLKVLGWRRADVIGRTSTEIGFWKDPDFRQRMVDALKRDGYVRGMPSQVRQLNGEIRDFIYSVDVIQFEDESLLLGIGRDVTDLRRAADRLRESMESAEIANRAKSEFLANMSHELRTPLNAILGFSEIIGAEMFGPSGHPRYVDYAKDIYSSGRMLLQIIDDLLDLSRVEHGKLALHAEALDADRVIEACLRLVDSRAQEAGLRLTTDLPEARLSFEADPLRLRQVLLNLLTNAIKFTAAGGCVTIGARPIAETDAIAFFVADTGIGMTETEIGLALQPFGQVANAMTRDHSGAGLGVPLAKGLTELHGGALAIESKPGAGTRVTVILPKMQRAPALSALQPDILVPGELPINVTIGGPAARG